jgi:hypothetical protein
MAMMMPAINSKKKINRDKRMRTRKFSRMKKASSRSRVNKRNKSRAAIMEMNRNNRTILIMMYKKGSVIPTIFVNCRHRTKMISVR